MNRLNFLEKKYRQKLFKELGAYLSSKRINAGLKQADIAKTSGYSSQFISNIECGTAFPPAKLLSQMIEEYGITQQEFLDTVMDLQMSYYRDVYFEKCSEPQQLANVRSAANRRSKT